MTPPVSNSNLCHTICFVIFNSSTVLMEHFMGMLRPKGVLRASNYKESTISTWSQGRRLRWAFLPPQPTAGGSSLSLDPQLFPLHAAVSPWALPGTERSLKLFLIAPISHKAQRNRLGQQVEGVSTASLLEMVK